MDLKDIRKQEKISQFTIAEQLSIKQAAYCHYETGKRQPPIDMLPKLANALNCSIEELVLALIETKQTATKKETKKLL